MLLTPQGRRKKIRDMALHPKDYWQGTTRSRVNEPDTVKHFTKLFKEIDIKCLGNGKSRIVFVLSKNHIIKIPMTSTGILGNKSEFDLAKNNRVIYPRCRLYGPSLIMIKVLTIREAFLGYTSVEDGLEDIESEFDISFPSWVYEYDCAQAGYHPKDGRVVMYDFEYGA